MRGRKAAACRVSAPKAPGVASESVLTIQQRVQCNNKTRGGVCRSSAHARDGHAEGSGAL